MREGPARRAYFAAQEAIFQTPCELSTYRIVLNGVWHVSVVGDEPPEELQAQLERALRAGDPVELPDDVLRALAERGKAERTKRLWTERHYR